MKVRHIVESETMECEELYMIATTACLTVYATVEEQNAAILAAKDVFKEHLDYLLAKAYGLGKKMMSADEKDKDMYEA